SAFPNGCHIAEVEVDPETGAARVVRYSAVNDLGTVVNPLLVEGQVQGGVVQGLGQVLLEQAVYDSDGKLVTGSFMDYAMPRAHDVPMINVASHPVPTKSNPLGAKGCGEAGTSGGLPSIANAVIDALSDYGVRHLEMPMTPARIWQAIKEARAGQLFRPPALSVRRVHHIFASSASSARRTSSRITTLFCLPRSCPLCGQSMESSIAKSDWLLLHSISSPRSVRLRRDSWSTASERERF